MLRMQERISTLDIASRSASGSTIARGLAAEFQGDRAQQLAAGGRDPPAHRGGSGEGHLVDAAGAAPARRPAAPDPVTRLTTPGRHARRPPTASTISRIDSGVGDAGLITTVQPASSAGASLMTTRLIGKFHGAISAHTPTGSRRTTDSPPPRGNGRTSSASRYAGQRGEVAEDAGGVGRRPGGLADRGAVLARVGQATAPRRASPPRRRCAAGSAARSDGRQPRPRPPESARRAEPTAASTSSGVPSGTEPHTSPVAGSVTGLRPVPRAGGPRAVDEEVVDVGVRQPAAAARAARVGGVVRGGGHRITAVLSRALERSRSAVAISIGGLGDAVRARSRRPAGRCRWPGPCRTSAEARAIPAWSKRHSRSASRISASSSDWASGRVSWPSMISQTALDEVRGRSPGAGAPRGRCRSPAARARSGSRPCASRR